MFTKPIAAITQLLKLSISRYGKINLMGNDLAAIYHFLQLSPTIATAGQPTVEQFPAIQAAGYQVVINLALSASVNAIPDEAAIVQGLGMAYIHIPVLWDQPTVENFQQFAEQLQAHRDDQVFVHCAANMRVSAFMYLYRRLYEGLDATAAAEDLHKIWMPNETWQSFMQCIEATGVPPSN
jgi:protein tyrosine phosphatase (PTP) superfamily phosphohydrolase (DUF442 family)